ncbi:MAG: cell envelope integrity protein TolA [Thalassolituus sp.]|jgi:colicin import membrane protein|uniref:TolA protein n=1 Tax=hydrothermal vent metagenome TaxID=652676 RepID=A0A160TEF5_9ZZZZ|nr:cell envelope integrity protein TolA [Thalassolituus oleivorans]PCI49186.1 MAG: protein TolA [Oceanospirillales bacterium]PHQ87875.1 MAG: protein TolA [Thalassobium sp.]MBQ0728055.1 cell envelope integrity protein TolA [Thalassolituus oleivorans]MBQ0782400.1 cell envelope integrity protein TolA [Thalassolituus oleivorans]MDF1641506.1 cell envelope integrity protein TolA [Thalassolituus oleivorans]|tara:strand:+ start:342 stop:1199 length:858 start_codon:yes stop_codon:yes gene_type:complete
MSWKSPNSYHLPVVAAVLIHAFAAFLLVAEWRRSEPHMPEPVPQHLIANVVQTENQAVKQREKEQQKKRDDKAKREKLAREKAAKEKAAKAAQEKAAKEKAAKEKANKEKADKAAKDKANKEKLAKEAALKEKAAKEKSAKEQAQREKAAQAAAEQALLEQMALEEASAEMARQEAAAKKAADIERSKQIAADSQTQIRLKIESVWQYPPAVQPDQEVVMKLVLVPTGQVIQAQVVKGSGNAALDRSVEQAIYKASPLPVPQDIRVFEQNFRTFTMKFRPENASW